MRELSKLGWLKVRDRGPHEIWGNGTYTMPIPRHVELHKHLALRLLREADELNMKQLQKERGDSSSAPTSPKKVSSMYPRISIQSIAKARISVLKALVVIEVGFTRTAQSWWKNFVPGTPIIPKVTTIPNLPVKGVDPTSLADASKLNKTLQDRDLVNFVNVNKSRTPSQEIKPGFEIDPETQKLFKNFELQQSRSDGSAASAGSTRSSPGSTSAPTINKEQATGIK